MENAHDKFLLNDAWSILAKLLSNIVSNPKEQKFRKINGQNAKIAVIFKVSKMHELLLLLGYSAQPDLVYIHEESDVRLLNSCLNILQTRLKPIAKQTTPEYLAAQEESRIKRQAEQEKKAKE